MKIFVFDLLAYGEHLDQLKVGNELPYPLSSVHFRPDVAVRRSCSGGTEERPSLAYSRPKLRLSSSRTSRTNCRTRRSG
jgi:hypothetical protein